MSYTCKTCGHWWTIKRADCLRCGAVWIPNYATPYAPTPEEIRAACLRIQATWSENEERKRRAAAYRLVPVDCHEQRAAATDGGRVNRKDVNGYV